MRNTPIGEFRPSRCAAATDRLAPAADVADFCSFVRISDQGERWSSAVGATATVMMSASPGRGGGAAAGDGADRAPPATGTTCATPGSATSAPLALSLLALLKSLLKLAERTLLRRRLQHRYDSLPGYCNIHGFGRA